VLCATVELLPWTVPPPVRLASTESETDGKVRRARFANQRLRLPIRRDRGGDRLVGGVDLAGEARELGIVEEAPPVAAVERVGRRRRQPRRAAVLRRFLVRRRARRVGADVVGADRAAGDRGREQRRGERRRPKLRRVHAVPSAVAARIGGGAPSSRFLFRRSLSRTT
jgi:hypothetical protein